MDENVEMRPPEASAVSHGVPVRGRANMIRSKRAKSLITRDRLCKATARLLEQKPLRAVKVSDITNMASLSPATFYIYFADVEEAVLAVLADITAEMPDFEATLSGVTPETLEAGLRNLIKAYLAFWDQHYAVLRIRNLAADEGEPRFRAARAEMLGPLLQAICETIEKFRGPVLGDDEVPAIAIATILSGTLERLAAIVRLRPPGRDLARGRLVDAAVLIVTEIMSAEHHSAKR